MSTCEIVVTGIVLIPIIKGQSELVVGNNSTPLHNPRAEKKSVSELVLKRREGYSHPAKEIEPVQANN